jgi:hypothetical protein
MKQPIRNISLLAVTVLTLAVSATLSAHPGGALQFSAPPAPFSGDAGAATRVAHRGGGLLQFSRTAYRVRETDRHATIEVERLGSLSGTVTVAYATSPGTALANLNYTAAAGTLTFAEWVKTQRFKVPVLVDGQVTGNKTVFLTLSAPTGGARLGPQRRAVLAIVNVDRGLTGTAAAGAPLASRLIRIKDKNGARRTGTTDSGGKFSVAVTGLAPTFLVKVEPPGVSGLGGPAGQAVLLGRAGPPVAVPLGLGSRAALTPVTVLDPQTTPLFSVGTAEAGVVNVHPFTDLIIRTWYEVQGTTVETVFEAPTTEPPAPSAEQVAVIASLVKDMLNIFLVAHGLDPITFDLIATPFDADGAGFDAVLEAAALEVNTLTQTTTVTLTNPGTSVTQTTALTIVEKLLKASTTTTGTQGAASASLSSAVAPTDPAVQAALTGALTLLQSLAAVVNSRGDVLDDGDLRPFFDDNYLNGGDRALQGSARLANFLRGRTINSITLDRILSYEDTTKVLTVNRISVFHSGGSFQNSGGFVSLAPVSEDPQFGATGVSLKQQADGKWLFFGNQQLFSVLLLVQAQNLQQGDPSCSDCDGVLKALTFHASAPVGTVSRVTVSGPDNLFVELTKGTPFIIDSLSRNFFFPVPPPSVTVFPPVGTVYTFTVTLASGAQQTIPRILGATTEEPPAFTNLTGHTLADAKLGQPLTINWALPTTLPIKNVRLFAHVNVGFPPISCPAEGTTPPLPATATSATITFPTTCKGSPVGEHDPFSPFVPSAQVQLEVNGVHDESSVALWGFR